jgi:replicative DNA helicase
VLTLKALASLHGERPQDARALLDETGLQPEDFTDKQTQALYVALAGVVRDAKPLELVSLMHATRHAVPRELTLEVVSGDNPELAPQRIKALRDVARRRRIVEQLEGVAKMVRTGISTESALGEVERVLRQVLQSNQTGPQAMDASLMTVLDRLEAVQAGTREPVLATGINALDYLIGGLQRTLTIIGAMPGVGKSALLASICRNIAAKGKRVGLLSLEDEREWLTERVLSEAAAVPLFVMGTKPLSKGQLGRVTDSGEGVHALLKNILCEDTAAMSPAEVVSAARAMVSRGCEAVLVDHLGEVRVERSQRHDLDILEVLQDLRGIAKTYRVPVVVACHLKRREGLDVDTEPRLSDFAFSAAVERCARVAIGLYRPERGKAERNNDEMGVVVLKQTKGPADVSFRLAMNNNSGTVAQTEPSDAMRQRYGTWREQ